jgi:hypothetical protein
MIFLVVAALVSGALSGWVFTQTADMSAVRGTLRQIHGHFLEFRLFFDEPVLIWRAQKELFLANVRLCALLLLPSFILVLPMAWLMLQLSDGYGVSALKVGDAAVVTAQLSTDINDIDSSNSLEAPAGIVVETEPLRVMTDRQLVWRIRPQRAITGDLRFKMRGVMMTKDVTASDSHGFISPRKPRAFLELLLHPEEGRLPAGSVLWLAVDYPKRAPWWIVWFLAISSISALVFVRWF